MSKKRKLFFHGLNELRAIAAFAVLIHHVELYKNLLNQKSLYDFNQYFKSLISDLGHNGVTLFFVLSGFLITYLLMVEKKSTGKISIRKFYGRRILRIWPLYFVIVIVGFWFLPFLYENFAVFFKDQHIYNERIETLVYGNNLVLHLFFLSNIALSLFGPVAGAAQSWSVSVEEQFYIVWPWIVSIFYKRLLYVLLIIVFGGVFAKYLVPDTIINKIYNVSRIDYMATGAIIAYWYKEHKSELVKLIKYKVFLIFLALSIGLHLVFKISNFTQAFTFGFLIVSCIEYNFNIKLLNNLGKLSYGIYMYHPFMMYLSFSLISKLKIADSIVYGTLVYITVIGFTLLISYVSYYYFELYFLKMKAKVSPILSGNI